MSEAFLGELRLFGFNFAPKDWAACTGQLMSINQNTALFSVLGTNFGGDGRVTFGLPNLGGNVCVGAGKGASGTQYDVGETGGTTSVALTESTCPKHSHSFNGLSFRTDAEGYVPGPTMSYANATGCTPFLAPATTPPMVEMAPTALSFAGTANAQAHANMMPTLPLNWCICTNGIFPPRP